METKGVLNSKTIIGIVISVLAALVDVGPELKAIFQPEAAIWFQKLLVVAGAVLAIYGRVTADTTIKGLTTEKKQEGKANPALLAVCAVILATLLFSGCATIRPNATLASAATAIETAADAVYAARDAGALNDEQFNKAKSAILAADGYLKEAVKAYDSGALDKGQAYLDLVYAAIKEAEGVQ